MAGQQGRSGGQREGAGRKSKAEEMELPALIEEVIGEEGKKELLKILYIKAKEGSFNHHQLLCYYLFGKPTEKVDAKVMMESIVSFRDAE